MYMKKYIIALFLMFFILILPLAGVYAAYETKNGFFLITKDEVIDDNVYVFEESVDIRGLVKGDLIVAAANINIKGSIEGDVIAIGEIVNILGDVDGDIRVIASNLQIDGSVGGNILGIADKIVINDDTFIGHSLTVAASILNMNGSIAKNIFSVGGITAINGKVGKNVKIYGNLKGEIILGSDSRIGGDLNYMSSKEIKRLEGAEIAGIIKKIDIIVDESNKDTINYILYKTLIFFSLVLSGLIFLYLFPNIAKEITIKSRKKIGATIFYGFAIFFLIPIASLMFFITVIGIPISLIAIILYIITFYLTKIIISLVMGSWLIGKIVKQNERSIIFEFLIGSIILSILVSVPFIGQIFWIFITWWGMGLIFIVLNKIYLGHKE